MDSECHHCAWEVIKEVFAECHLGSVHFSRLILLTASDTESADDLVTPSGRIGRALHSTVQHICASHLDVNTGSRSQYNNRDVYCIFLRRRSSLGPLRTHPSNLFYQSCE